MNNKIKKLKAEAFSIVAKTYDCPLAKFTDNLDESVRAEVDEVFAKLIIDECENLLLKKYNTRADYPAEIQPGDFFKLFEIKNYE